MTDQISVLSPINNIFCNFIVYVLGDLCLSICRALMYIQKVPSFSLQIFSLCPGLEVANSFGTQREKKTEKQEFYRRNKELPARIQTSKQTQPCPQSALVTECTTWHFLNQLLDCNSETQTKSNILIFTKYNTGFYVILFPCIMHLLSKNMSHYTVLPKHVMKNPPTYPFTGAEWTCGGMLILIFIGIKSQSKSIFSKY